MIKKIIAGGHPGAERAALDAAIKLDIPHSGWAYKGRKTDEGILPEKYQVKESDPLCRYFKKMKIFLEEVNSYAGSVG